MLLILHKAIFASDNKFLRLSIEAGLISLAGTSNLLLQYLHDLKTFKLIDHN